jgi:MYXO-CTERM domain-containing protein
VLTDGESASFELALGADAALVGRPELTVWTQLLGMEGKAGKAGKADKPAERVHGHLRFTLSDCGAAGCNRLAKGDLNLDRLAGAAPEVEDRTLSKIREVVRGGDVLRLTFVADVKPGVSVALLYDGAPTPSRVVLPGGGVTSGGEAIAGALVLGALVAAEVRRRRRRR